MSSFELLSLLISLLAAGISAYALIRGHRLSLRQTELQQEQARLAALQHKLLVREQEARAKADIRAEMVRHGNGYRFNIFNAGPSTARNLRVTPLAVAGVEHPLSRSNAEEILPAAELRSGESVSVRLMVHLGSQFPMSVIFTWDDESGDDQQREMRVGL
jgi:hypothetical protein